MPIILATFTYSWWNIFVLSYCVWAVRIALVDMNLKAADHRNNYPRGFCFRYCLGHSQLLTWIYRFGKKDLEKRRNGMPLNLTEENHLRALNLLPIIDFFCPIQCLLPTAWLCYEPPQSTVISFLAASRFHPTWTGGTIIYCYQLWF